MDDILAWARRLVADGRLALLGLAIPQIWMYAAHQQASRFSALSFALLYGAFVTVLLAGALIARAHASDDARGRPSPIGTHAAGMAAIVGMCLFPACRLFGALGLAGTPVADVAFLLCAVLGGGGAAVWFLRWFQTTCRVCLHDGVGFILLGFALAAAISTAVSVAAATSELLAAPLLVVIALATLPAERRAVFSAETHCAPCPGDSPTADRLGIASNPSMPTATRKLDGLGLHLPLVVGELVLFSLVLGLLQGTGPEAQGNSAATWAALALRIAVPLALFCWVGWHGGKAGLVNVSQFVLIAIAVVFVALALAGPAAGVWLSILASVARNFVLVLLTVVLLYIVHACGSDPHFAYGIGRGIHALGTLVGVLAHFLLDAGGLPFALSLNVVLFLVAITFLMLGASSAQAVRLLEEDAARRAGEGHGPGVSATDPAATPAPTPDQLVTATMDALDARCDELAAEHGLTERETDIVKLLAKGRSRGFIATDLVISENTVRFHCRNAYAKLGIHTKQELLSLIGVE